MRTPATGVQEWEDIDWPKAESAVHTLQRRIYRASLRDDKGVVHRLQRLLTSSWTARCLAVRKVTQDNRGKKTAGVDGIASLDPDERLALVHSLDLERQPMPTRRVWIPKPGTNEQRPLGIPTMTDRATQALVKLALEPQWEAKFEPNSYGFRPGRSAHDAVGAIFDSIRFVPKWVLDADIAKCFDRIDHEALLDKIGTFPLLRRVIQAWLKAGVLDGETLFPTEEGTPQGGVISPLLANVALHGLEEAIVGSFPREKRWGPNKAVTAWWPTVTRYADDFVVLHRERDVVEQCQTIAREWLRGMGLELKPSKTRICHTLEEVDGQVGFDFLGFNVRQRRVGKHHTGADTRGRPLGFKTLITPSKDKVVRHHRQIAEVIRKMKARSQKALIDRLNPIIRGWCLYYRTVVSGATFRKLDVSSFRLLWSWAKRRHQKKGLKWVARRYWRDGWRFQTPTGWKLAQHAATKPLRHAKVAGTRSPFDGDWAYWAGRLGTYPGIPAWVGMLLKRQGGRCARCNLYFLPDSTVEIVEVHHKDQDRSNNKRSNLEALHAHCHQAAHREGSVTVKASVVDTHCTLEEPDERESLTSGSEDQPAGRPAG